MKCFRPQCCPFFWRANGDVLRSWIPLRARQMDDLEIDAGDLSVGRGGDYQDKQADE
jgi:hypothetical protein